MGEAGKYPWFTRKHALARGWSLCLGPMSFAYRCSNRLLGEAEKPLLLGETHLSGFDITKHEAGIATAMPTLYAWVSHLQERSPLLLTDDYVPVDNLLASVFADFGS